MKTLPKYRVCNHCVIGEKTFKNVLTGTFEKRAPVLQTLTLVRPRHDFGKACYLHITFRSVSLADFHFLSFGCCFFFSDQAYKIYTHFQACFLKNYTRFCKIHTSFQAKMFKTGYALFQTKTTQKPYPFASHIYLYSLYRGVSPLPPGTEILLQRQQATTRKM